MSKSTRQVAAEISISEASVRRIAKFDLHLSAFKRMPVQVLNDATKLKRLTHCKMLLRRLTVKKMKHIFSPMRKFSTFNRQLTLKTIAYGQVEESSTLIRSAC